MNIFEYFMNTLYYLLQVHMHASAVFQLQFILTVFASLFVLNLETVNSNVYY